MNENEKHAVANTRGILMPAHQVRVAISQAVARGQLMEEDGEGYDFEALAGGMRPVASDDDDDNAASLAFLDQMATV